MNKNNWFGVLKKLVRRQESISVLLILLFITAALFSVFISPHLYQQKIHEGNIALKDVYAPYDFSYFWKIDEDSTLKAKEAASADVPYFFKRDVASEKKALTGINHFFELLDMERKRAVPIGEKVSGLKDSLGKELPEKNIKLFLEYPDADKLKEKVLSVFDRIFLIGYVSEKEAERLKEEKVRKVTVFNENTGDETKRSPQDLLRKQGMETAMDEYITEQFEDSRKMKQPVLDLVAEYIRPNLEPDDKKTVARKEEAVKKAKPIYHKWTVKKNELIIEKGKRVDGSHIAQISQLRRVFRPGITPTFFFGVLLLFLLLCLVAAIHSLFNQKENFLRNTRDIAIVLLNMFVMIVLADFIMRSPQPTYFIPMAGMGMIITLLVGFNAAFISVVLMSILISLLVGGKIEVTLALMVGSTVGMFAVKDARRRGKILLAGLLAGLAKFAAIICIGLINDMELDFYVKDGIWGIASGIFSGFMVMGLLPVFEYIFKTPTNISLLELSDLNHPLLKKLAMEAPGTYHHSIMVGNLAEAACDSIGANSLLARVGAYYHDIGKMSKAEYFSENEMGTGSRHVNLTPSMSALIIGKHVKDGVETAKKYKLNDRIIDFITQHHGDSLIYYFYQEAVKKAGEGAVLDKENFRYPGPRPQTKESAIILLSDSVEASSRTLSDPTPSSIRNLVRKIINNKFIDGQLDECDLTLRDMHEIADSFVRVLMGVFHSRLSYPEDVTKEQNGMLPQDNANNNKKPKYEAED